MTEQERAEIKLKIEKELQSLLEQISEYQGMAGPVSPDNAIGRISRMDAIVNKSVVETALRECEERRKKLLYAQQRIDTANFGKCIQCGQEIPAGRIRFKPESTHCMRCAR